MHVANTCTEHEIRTEKCSDTCQIKINLLTCTIALYFGSDICQIKLGFVQVNPKVLRKGQMSNCYFILCNVYKDAGSCYVPIYILHVIIYL